MKRGLVTIAIALLALAPSADAANFNMTCTVASSTLPLNPYDVLAGTATGTPSGSITVTCSHTANQTITVDYKLALSTSPTRLLANGASTLTYDLYTDATFSTVWGTTGTCTAGSNANNGALICGSFSIAKNTNGTQTKTYYARIPGGADVPVGTYSQNNIAVTLTFSCNPAPTGGGTC